MQRQKKLEVKETHDENSSDHDDPSSNCDSEMKSLMIIIHVMAWKEMLTKKK